MSRTEHSTSQEQPSGAEQAVNENSQNTASMASGTASKKKKSFIVRAADFISVIMGRFLPDPFTIALLLTLVAMVLAIVVRGTTPVDVLTYWGEGFWGLLEFTMQMALIMLCGFIVAKTPLVDRFLSWLTSLVSTPRQAIVLITLVGLIGSWLNWGFGLIVGGIIAQKVGASVRGLHYPLAVSAGYSGFLFYGIGLSGSVPVTIATDGHFLEEQMGIIPLGQTIFSPYLLIMVLVMLVALPLFNASMHPRDPAEVAEKPRDAAMTDAPIELLDKSGSFAARLNNSRLIGIGIGVIGLVYLVIYFFGGGALHLNAVNFALMFIGILLFARPIRYMAAVNEGVKNIGSIVIQFPFYAGIMGLLIGSGLVDTLADLFVRISTAETLPFWSFISGGVINLFAPSGGGQWAVQGPLMIEAAHQLGADLGATAMGVQIGDLWTNMILPIWMLPVLSIAGMKLRSIMGYQVLILIFSGVIFAVTTLVWGFMAA